MQIMAGHFTPRQTYCGVNELEKELLLSVRGMSKAFGPTQALSNVDIDIYRGEIRGLIGENGSGKSTLSSIIAGIQPGDTGEMTLEGKPYAPSSPLEAADLGVCMIVQEVGTIATCTIAQNIFIGREREFRGKWFVSGKKMNETAELALEKIGAEHIPVKAPAQFISFEDKKLVEVARAVWREPDIIIIDETTTALSQDGRETIYKLMKRFKAENKAVIFISHDLDELIEVCDELTVLRDGEMVANLAGEDINKSNIKRLMVGRELAENFYRSDWDGSHSGEVVLEVENLTAGFTLELASLKLHKGEILGIGGLSDCGMHELGTAMFGALPALSGEVRTADGAVIDSPDTAIKNRIGFVSKDRDAAALMLAAPIRDNVALPYYDNLKKGLLISAKKVRDYTNAQIKKLSIKCEGEGAFVESLSGGNKQKVSFAKWTGNGSEILILDCPTRGVDVGVKGAMYDFIYQCKLEGKAIIMISEELPELIGMSDRILIMKYGKFTAEFQRSEELTQEQIVEHMI